MGPLCRHRLFWASFLKEDEEGGGDEKLAEMLGGTGRGTLVILSAARNSARIVSGLLYDFSLGMGFEFFFCDKSVSKLLIYKIILVIYSKKTNNF